MLLALLAGCKPRPEPALLQEPAARLLGCLAPTCLAAAALGPGSNSEALLSSLLGLELSGPLSDPLQGAALGHDGNGWVGLLAPPALPVLEAALGLQGAQIPTTKDLMAWAEGPDAGNRARNLAARLASGSGAPSLARVWPELSGALPWRPGTSGLWLALSQAVEGRWLAFLEGRLDFPGLAALDAPSSREFLEVLNLGALEAALFLLHPDGALHGGVYVWPDRIGLPGLLLGAESGLESGLPEQRQGLLLRLAPARLENLLEGLRSMAGPFSSFLRGPRAELLRSLANGLDGTLFLETTPSSVTIGLKLASGPGGEKLRSLAAAGSLAAGLLAPSQLSLSIHGNDLFLRSGPNAPEPFALPGGTPKSALLGVFDLGLSSAPKARLAARIERVPWGLSVSGRLTTP